MILNFSSAVFALLASTVVTVPAPGLAISQITADNGTVWQTKKTGDTTQGFFEIRNDADVADSLTGWSCALADTTTLSGADGQAMQSLQIPAGKTVILAPDGPHLILQSTHFTVDRGSIVPCSLTFQNEGDIAVLLYAVPAKK